MADLVERLKAALADRYAIERELGSGGMATVYLAEDRKHHRPVALKVLRPQLAAILGPERFLREIELAAGLTHPHILPVHDSGEAGGFLYYVMPYVEGESLRGRLDREKQLPVDDALQIAREVADALSYAHSRGVIHRDVKPENILLEAGHAVVADFGIARAIDAAGGEKLTETGVTLGTPAYMSPEQAGGSRDMDGRSDLYSLGCVLHEMLAGQAPFAGPTIESVVAQHLSADPPDVSAIRPSVPSWVVSALRRSLAKAPADRFNPVALFGEAIAPRASVAEAGGQRGPAVTDKRRRVAPVAIAAGLFVVIAVLIARLTVPMSITITTSNSRAVTREPGLEFQPAISPDGMEVAYIERRMRDPRTVVTSTVDVGSGGASRPGGDVDGGHWFPSWAPDGASLRFLLCPGQPFWNDTGCTVKEVGTHGGAVRTVDVPATSVRHVWSRDGERVAFARRDSIFAYDAGGGEPALLAVVPVIPGYGFPHSLAWSPDGRLIAFVNGNKAWRTTANVLGASIWILEADGGEPVRVTDDSTMNVSPQWLPDSEHLLFVSDRGGQREVYVVKVGRAGARGDPQKVAGPIDAHSISISADGRSLAYAKFSASQNIVAIPIPRTGSVSVDDAVPVTEGNQVIEGHDLSPDGEWIVYSSNLRGAQGIYKQRLAGGAPELVVDLEGSDHEPGWSGDGTEIAFYNSLMDGILAVPADGGATVQVTNFPLASRPSWSPDGLAIAFHSTGPQDRGEYHIWIVSRDSVGGPWGNPVQLTDFRSGNPAWDPDGGSVVCASRGGWVRVSRDGEILARYEPSMFGLQTLGVPRFSRDGLGWYALGTDEDGSRGIWWIPRDGGEATRVVEIDDPTVGVSPPTVGPRHLYVTFVKYESDIWVTDLDW